MCPELPQGDPAGAAKVAAVGPAAVRLEGARARRNLVAWARDLLQVRGPVPVQDCFVHREMGYPAHQRLV